MATESPGWADHSLLELELEQLEQLGPTPELWRVEAFAEWIRWLRARGFTNTVLVSSSMSSSERRIEGYTRAHVWTREPGRRERSWARALADEGFTSHRDALARARCSSSSSRVWL